MDFDLQYCQYSLTGFLEVVIGPERIKIEEEKVKVVLNWLTLKEVKKCIEVFKTSQLLLAVY